MKIAAEKHLARNLRVARLVRSKQRQLAEAVKVKCDDDDERVKCRLAWQALKDASIFGSEFGL